MSNETVPSTADQIVLDECTCIWGYENGHDYCAEPDADCVIHGCSEYALKSEKAQEVAARLADADTAAFAVHISSKMKDVKFIEMPVSSGVPTA
jgi:hypothetical protein